MIQTASSLNDSGIQNLFRLYGLGLQNSDKGTVKETIQRLNELLENETLFFPIHSKQRAAFAFAHPFDEHNAIYVADIFATSFSENGFSGFLDEVRTHQDLILMLANYGTQNKYSQLIFCEPSLQTLPLRMALYAQGLQRDGREYKFSKKLN